MNTDGHRWAGLLLVLGILAGGLHAEWVAEGPRRSAEVDGGEIRISGKGGFPCWMRTEREYEDFKLEFEYKLAQWAEGAVYLRAPRAGRPGRAGLAVVLTHDFHKQVTPYVTGAIRGVRAPAVGLPESWGKWQRVEIELSGDRLQAKIDGAVVQDVDLAADPELRLRLKRGYIGFPDLGYAWQVRNVKIEDLGGQHEFVQLFDGISLDGWDLKGGADWVIRDGVIRASNGHGVYYAPGEFEDFEFIALVRSHERANGGIFFRGGPEGFRGFEVQIYSPPNAVYPTGSIYNHVRSDSSVDYEEQWFLMQVIVKGRSCSVRLDGRTVAETDALAEAVPGKGRIGLQMHMDTASVEWRDLRIRPLD
jgi:3-keto-disaccharide hydrolase